MVAGVSGVFCAVGKGLKGKHILEDIKITLAYLGAQDVQLLAF